MIKSLQFSDDTCDLLLLFQKHKVEYVIAGGEAVIYYGYPRLTGDIDLFFRNSEENVQKIFDALQEFWGGKIPGIPAPDILAEPGCVIQFGYPPNRIDLLNSLSGITYEEAADGSASEQIQYGSETIMLNIISITALIKNKKAAGRNKDLDDVEYLIRR